MTLPLVSHQEADSVLVFHGQDRITRGRFICEVEQLAARLPDANYAINLCQNRYYFLLAFAAVCLRGQTNLLPASQAAGTLQTLAQRYPDHHLVDDDRIRNSLAKQTPPSSNAPAWPTLPKNLTAAIAFTSGSTGEPQGHLCNWSTLMGSAQRSALRIFTQRNLKIVATVPPQHMFGLETTILQPLANDCAIHSGRPFFPAEIFDVLQAVAAPCALVTTPAHLKTCLAATKQAPRVQFVLSATAPLSPELAARVENAWSTQVLEIYGSTETGAIATRRPSQGDLWHLMPGGDLVDTPAGSEYRAEHCNMAVLLHDSLIRSDATHFILGARNQDLIKVAGKRTSLAELNARLLAIDGVIDGIIFQPRPDERVAALVVVNNLTEHDIQRALAVHLDAAFLPRPLRIVTSLPRDAVGKLPRAQLLTALESA